MSEILPPVDTSVIPSPPDVDTDIVASDICDWRDRPEFSSASFVDPRESVSKTLSPMEVVEEIGGSCGYI